MRLWITYVFFLLLGVGFFCLLLSFSENPEQAIVGEWEEVEYNYEAHDKNVMIHKDEVWDFQPGGTFQIIASGETQKGNWSIKGRGHILQLKYSNSYIENYNIDVLKEGELVLNQEEDLEVRGISKLTFKKI